MADYIEEHYDFPLTKRSENKPLKGVRVIDAGNMVAAVFNGAARRLRRHVVKIEHPTYGDGQRKLGRSQVAFRFAWRPSP
jgi:crotonobetainyl-CoA:carnitine CoA-transferase CaiB-like acyl-CoA transferase